MARENPNNVCEEATETMNSELPDCVISYIFSKLSTRDFVKTSTLSKRWFHEWRSRMDLNFDIHNMFDSNTIREFNSSFNISRFQNEFAKRVDRSMLYYQGAKIRSLKLNFPLGDEYSEVIDRLISQGIAKGIERIELLLFYTKKPIRIDFPTNPYKFSYTLLPESDSLKYLHLQQCLLVPPMDFSGLKKLQTLVLQQVTIKQDMLLGLFSNCIHLVDLTLRQCKFKSDINITSSTLRHLDIIFDWNHTYQLYPLNIPLKINIDALNLSSFDYSCHMRISSIKAPRLLKLFWGATHEKEEISYSFDLIASLQQLENLVMSMSHSHVARLPRELGPFQNLRQLEFSIYGAYSRNMDYLQILDIVMASPHLQKLFLTISRPHLKHPHSVAYQRKKREHARFFHNELKHAELRGCVGPINAIELTSHFLKNVTSLKQITFSPCNRFYIGAERWTNSFDCRNCLGCNLVREMLKDEVNEQCRIIIL